MFSQYSKSVETKIKSLISRIAKSSLNPSFPSGNKKLPPIKDTYLLLTALKTYGNYNTSENSHHTFTRLAFLGDSILGYNGTKIFYFSFECLTLVSNIIFTFSKVTDHLHEKFPSYSNGKLTLYRSMLVSSSQLSTFARQWGLDEIAKVDLTLAKKNNRILGEALEAYIGAFYLDCCQMYGVSDAHMKKLHQAAIKAMIKEIEVTDGANNTKSESDKQEMNLIPGGAANRKSKSAIILKAENPNTKITDTINQSKSLENPTQTKNTSIKSKNTQELTQQQIKAKEKIKKKQLKESLISHDLVTKNISKKIESNHQMLKELKRQKRKQAELKKLSVKQLLTRLRRLV
ncbi:hypothetical protein C1645_740421 [Glomus cerebriforme]|uniref:RNase III domain-containing protein n=1 Tax=Glomus cerebriforme TaxID=658196 RepID=A0A397SMX6_9GLOM|nr:hypothetical protein C1645_740421 [Glomus cerebriforme]